MQMVSYSLYVPHYIGYTIKVVQTLHTAQWALDNQPPKKWLRLVPVGNCYPLTRNITFAPHSYYLFFYFKIVYLDKYVKKQHVMNKWCLAILVKKKKKKKKLQIIVKKIKVEHEIRTIDLMTFEKVNIVNIWTVFEQ